MIRFIDIRGQGTGFRFSFFDTSTKNFILGKSGHGWDDKNDIDSHESLSQEMKDRLISLLPEWAYFNETPEEPVSKDQSHTPDIVSYTWDGILMQLNRYGNQPDARLFEILNLLSDINDDMAHARPYDPEVYSGIQSALDALKRAWEEDC